MCARIGVALLLLGIGACIASAETPASPKKPFLVASLSRSPVATLRENFVRPSASATLFFSGPEPVRASVPGEFAITPPRAHGAWRAASWILQETLGDDGMRAAKQGLSRAKHFGLKK